MFKDGRNVECGWQHRQADQCLWSPGNPRPPIGLYHHSQKKAALRVLLASLNAIVTEMPIIAEEPSLEEKKQRSSTTNGTNSEPEDLLVGGGREDVFL